MTTSDAERLRQALRAQNEHHRRELLARDSDLALARDRLRDVELLAAKWVRSTDERERLLGSDLLQVVRGDAGPGPIGVVDVYGALKPRTDLAPGERKAPVRDD